jgi:hypothetical protein
MDTRSGEILVNADIKSLRLKTQAIIERGMDDTGKPRGSGSKRKTGDLDDDYKGRKVALR